MLVIESHAVELTSNDLVASCHSSLLTDSRCSPRPMCHYIVTKGKTSGSLRPWASPSAFTESNGDGLEQSVRLVDRSTVSRDCLHELYLS